jgi:hypothetical protein
MNAHYRRAPKLATKEDLILKLSDIVFLLDEGDEGKAGAVQADCCAPSWQWQTPKWEERPGSSSSTAQER